MALLHHLARTGGTLISRCLASMDGVCLLSEINPLGTSHFNPLRQAAQWYALVSDDEVADLEPGDAESFFGAMDLIRTRAELRGLSLVIRDWSHADWVGFPFVPVPPLSFSWDRVRAAECLEASALPAAIDNFGSVAPATQTLALAAEAPAPFTAVRCATVRHPIDQYLSSRRLEVLNRSWDEQAVWQGMYKFAEAVQAMPWFRYEDFLAEPEETLEQICAALLIPYDPSWKHGWAAYTRITGDSIDARRTAVEPVERKAVAAISPRICGG